MPEASHKRAGLLGDLTDAGGIFLVCPVCEASEHRNILVSSGGPRIGVTTRELVVTVAAREASDEYVAVHLVCRNGHPFRVEFEFEDVPRDAELRVVRVTTRWETER
jgi:hypothetical protein